MLQVQDVCKTFDGGRGALEVLRDIRFNVAAGEFISIIGPSGCGKTRGHAAEGADGSLRASRWASGILGALSS
jgi:ABC-type glutathione transport system ATPase component